MAAISNAVQLADRGLRAAEHPDMNSGCIVCDVALKVGQNVFCSLTCECTYLAVVGGALLDIVAEVEADR